MASSARRRDNENLSAKVVEGFGHEWHRFDQLALDEDERQQLFDQYFALFPWHELPPAAIGVDVGCGSGRWATMMAERVEKLHVVEPSVKAMEVARRALSTRTNVIFHDGGVAEMQIEDGSLDFAYSLGVLHHLPDTAAGLRSCIRTLKPGAPFLVYLYYAFDNRPSWFRALWRISNFFRRCISRLPYGSRYMISQLLAAGVYLPLARLAGALKERGVKVDDFPLASYANRSFYTMRTDALDRFGTRLERRFTKVEVEVMLHDAGCTSVIVSGPPYWCALGYKV